MSQEIQLAFNRAAPATQIEPWAMGGGTALGSPAAAQPNPLHKIHRSMRGRYLLAAVLALLGAAAGGAAGYMGGEAGYVSTGAIQVRPVIPDLEKADTVMQMYDRYMRTQAAILMGERLIQFAVERPEWKAVNPVAAPNPVPAFAANLKAEFVKDSEIISVSYTHTSPEVAQAGVKAVIGSYVEHFANTESEGLETKLQTWENISREAARSIDTAEQQIKKLGRQYRAEDVSIFEEAAKTEVVRLEKEIAQLEAELRKVEAPGPASEDMAVEDIAQVDPQMARWLDLRLKIEEAINDLKLRGFGPKQPAVVQLEAKLKAHDADIHERAERFREKYKGHRFMPRTTDGPDGMPRMTIVPLNPEEMRANVEDLRALLAKQQETQASLSTVRQDIAAARETRTEQKERLKQATEQIEKLTFRIENLGRVQVIADGTLGSPLDNRTKLALVGVVGGGGVMLGLMLMIGLLDTRYRYSDEANSTDMQGVTLLGILPNLPDRLSDPEQAAIAAHCVHQIRTMLQINGGAETAGERRVFAVTSASPGDGKTSLTLALGLSYAACGTRTLLIDCDLVGAGLSTRMNVHASEGVLEAIANRSLLDYVRTTDIADVAILPVGSAHGYHASTLSPGALRRLIDEAKKHFDTILVDTGPVLGSIEASLVCAAADGVVLAVSRGQSRPLVEKSLNHLAGIGARLAGVVFNRAQSNDFERSISGMSMRSVAAANGKSSSNGNGRAPSAAGEAVGPVARAVATHARRADGHEG
jgi:succinoglycan biosynthesis transport protein ExoP